MWQDQGSRGMSLMSLILILSYMLKEVTNSNILYCLEIQRFAHISGTKFRIIMGFGSKCRILNGLLDYIEHCWHVTHFPWSCHILIMKTMYVRQSSSKDTHGTGTQRCYRVYHTIKVEFPLSLIYVLTSLHIVGWTGSSDNQPIIKNGTCCHVWCSHQCSN